MGEPKPVFLVVPCGTTNGTTFPAFFQSGIASFFHPFFAGFGCDCGGRGAGGLMGMPRCRSPCFGDIGFVCGIVPSQFTFPSGSQASVVKAAVHA
jgi:hypothetical protein